MMRFFYWTFFFCTLTFSSCDYFSFSSKPQPILIDTIVDFTKVDNSPAFIACRNLIDTEKTNCFRKELHRKIANYLTSVNFTVEETIDETIFLHLQISNKGVILLKEIEASSYTLEQIPALDSLLKASIQKLPTITPATKRGIPVNTTYKLPIKIEIAN
ncbi:hypothetical protein [Tenacibaculum sp. 190524A02b]|uniref:TonB C-terminal domain-containing protein n=1 Tax=Tenacibaculum vairaonense TaxID=3137860 RepID=A0ABP1F5V2_9FLAO